MTYELILAAGFLTGLISDVLVKPHHSRIKKMLLIFIILCIPTHPTAAQGIKCDSTDMVFYSSQPQYIRKCLCTACNTTTTKSNIIIEDDRIMNNYLAQANRQLITQVKQERKSKNFWKVFCGFITTAAIYFSLTNFK